MVSRDFSVVEAFAALAVEENGFVAEDAADEIVHCWFFEFAPILLAVAVETRRPFYLFSQEIADIYPLTLDSSYLYLLIRPLRRAFDREYIDISQFCTRMKSHSHRE